MSLLRIHVHWIDNLEVDVNEVGHHVVIDDKSWSPLLLCIKWILEIPSFRTPSLNRESSWGSSMITQIRRSCFLLHTASFDWTDIRASNTKVDAILAFGSVFFARATFDAAFVTEIACLGHPLCFSRLLMQLLWMCSVIHLPCGAWRIPF